MVCILANPTNHFFLRSSHQIGLTPELNKVSNIASAVPVSSVRPACTLSHQLQCQSRRWDPIGYRQTVVVAWWTSTLPTPAENAESFYAFPAFSGMLHRLHCSNYLSGVKVHKKLSPHWVSICFILLFNGLIWWSTVCEALGSTVLTRVSAGVRSHTNRLRFVCLLKDIEEFMFLLYGLHHLLKRKQSNKYSFELEEPGVCFINQCQSCCLLCIFLFPPQPPQGGILSL